MAGDKEKILALLGLARRAGKLAMGFHAVEKQVRRGEKPLVILAMDVGPSQKNKVLGWTPVREFVGDLLTKEEMARTLGRDMLGIVGVSDSGFVRGIRAGLQDGSRGGEPPQSGDPER